MPLLTFSSYIFDARNFDRAQNIQKGHVAAVMDVEFSPTGEELVSGSYVCSPSQPSVPKGLVINTPIGPHHQSLAPRPGPVPRHLPHQAHAEGLPHHVDHGLQVPPQRKRRRTPHCPTPCSYRTPY